MRIFVRKPDGDICEARGTLDSTVGDCVAPCVGHASAMSHHVAPFTSSLREGGGADAHSCTCGHGSERSHDRTRARAASPGTRTAGDETLSFAECRSCRGGGGGGGEAWGCGGSGGGDDDNDECGPFAGQSVTYGGRSVCLGSTLREAGVQADGVLSVGCGLWGGSELAMKIAYKRDKEHKRKNAKSSKFVSLIRELVEREEAAAEAEAKARGEAAQDEDYDAFARVPPPPFAPTPLGEARAEGRLGAELRARALHGYLTLGWAVHTWCTRSFWFECFIMANILAVGASTGLSLNGEEDGSPAVATLVQVVNDVTMWVFVAEALLKLLSYGAQPLHYFTAPNGEGSFNSFDFLLVVLSLALAGESSAGGIKTLRLARLVRLLTIIKNVPELKVIVEGLVAGLKSVGYIVLLLLLVIYLFAVLGVMQFGANDPANFGKLPVAMVTLFQVSTLSSWSNIAYIQWFGCDKFIRGWYDGSDESGETVMTMTGPLLVWQCSAPSAQPLFTFVYFTAFTIVTAMVILSLFIGVIAMGMFDS